MRKSASDQLQAVLGPFLNEFVKESASRQSACSLHVHLFAVTLVVEVGNMFLQSSFHAIQIFL